MSDETPEVTPEGAEVANEDVESTPQPEIETPDEPEGEEGEQPPKKGVAKRIDELTRNWRETERDRDHWRELAMRAQQKPPEPQAPPQPGKTLEDFEYDEGKYQSYLLEQAREEARRIVQDEYKRESQTRKQGDFRAKEAEFSKTHEDYNAVTRNPTLSLTQDMVDVVADSDKGPDVLYYLGKNPEIADTLSRLSPVQMAREIGRIEAKLATPKGSSVSKAPPPTPKIEAVEPAINVRASEADSDKLSTKEWLAKREKEVNR